MERCSLYSHQLGFETLLQIVKDKLSKYIVQVGEEGELNKTIFVSKRRHFLAKPKTISIKYRQRQSPSYILREISCPLTKNLAGMVNFVQSIPADNKEIQNLFLQKLMSVNAEISIQVEPDFIPEFEAIISQALKELDGFIFTDSNSFFTKSKVQHFVDQDLNLILDTDGKSDIKELPVIVDAKYHDGPKTNYSQDQLDRKESSELFLEKHGVKLNTNLPCLPDIQDIEIRSKNEMIDRAYALLVIAAKGEGIEQEHLSKVVESKKIGALSPIERQLFQAEDGSLSDEQRAYATWRYESLYVLLWALNHEQNLKYPSEICDVQSLVAKLIQPTREAFEASSVLKPKEEILNELDKVYRMHWASVDARIKSEDLSGKLNPSIVYERHYVLNWLSNIGGQAWDDIQTNT